MSFLMFQVLFAALALGLLVVIGLIVRQIVTKRHPKVPQAAREAPLKAPRLRKSAPAKPAEPEPQESQPEAPARRRQLQSFADAERSAAEAEAVVLPVAVPETEAEPEATLAAGLDAEAETALAQPEPEPAPEAGQPGYDEAVLGRLEEAFEALQSGELTLEAYRARVLDEEAAVEERVAALQDGGDGAELEAALAARDAVLWCLDWAEDQARAAG